MKSLLKDLKWVIMAIIAILAIVIPILIDHQKEKQTTQIKYYVPESNQNLDLQKVEIAECWYGSVTVERIDAFRCMDGNYIYDPCFEVPFSNKLVSCPITPFSGDVYFTTETNTAKGKNDNFGETPSYPWFIKLMDDTECRMVSGATNLIANNRMDYSCNEEEDFWLLLPIEKDGRGISAINCWNGREIKKCQIKEICH